MFNVGDYIVCGSNGVCCVENVGTLDLDGIPKDRLYYTLRPYYSRGGTVFTPVDNQKVVMRPILTREEANELLEEIEDIETLWIGNEKVREMRYKEALRTCDCREIVKIIKTIYMRKKMRIAEGKKVTFIDEKYFKMAESSFYGELALSLGIDKDSVKNHIIRNVKAAKRA